MKTFADSLDNTIYSLEYVNETKAWATGGTFSFATEMPYTRDILGLIFECTGQADSGTAITKVLDNVFQLIAELNIACDGQSKIHLYDYEIKWFSWYMVGFEPEIMETDDATSQSNQAFFLRFIIPCGFKKGVYKKVTVNGIWGLVADLDSGSGFNVDSATLKITALLGSGVTRQFYTLRHGETKNGDGQFTVPDGTLEGIILQATARGDTIDTYSLIHDGFAYYNNVNHEMNRVLAKQLHNIDLFGVADRDDYRLLQIGMLFIDGQGLVSKSGNMILKYKTTSSVAVSSLYIFSKDADIGN